MTAAQLMDALLKIPTNKRKNYTVVISNVQPNVKGAQPVQKVVTTRDTNEVVIEV